MSLISDGARSARGSPGRSLYDPRFEHDACGVGFVARISGDADHAILRMALEAVERLAHRGAIAADGKSGDGAGLLTQLPRRLFAREAKKLGRVGADDPLGVGMVFLPHGNEAPAAALERALEARGLEVLGWRPVPIDPGSLGTSARASLPLIRQILIRARPGGDPERFERELYLARKAFEREGHDAYVCSLSCRTVVYKALCAASQLRAFYADLSDPVYETPLAVYHQRYSTNTFPSWGLAQPFRLLAHNGEINTLWGNRSRMRARETELPKEVRPVLDEQGSDSTNLDEALELLARNGRDPVHGLSMLIVPAWEQAGAELGADLAEFYRYHLPLMEPWDGPAALAFTDGRYVGAALDRNGLRPCRFKVTSDGLVVAGSEVGVFELDPRCVVESDRLGPGQMLVVDTATGRVFHDREVKADLATRRPFARWAGARLPVPRRARGQGEARDVSGLTRLQLLYGLTAEDLRLVLGSMAETGKPPVWSMGDDTPIAPLARAPRSLYVFFRQRFAQVTNPAIDPIREACVMSLRTWLGGRPALLADGPQEPLLELRSPVLDVGQLACLRRQREVKTTELACVFSVEGGTLTGALDSLTRNAEAAVRDGARLLILSDRDASPVRAPIPMALAVGAVHHHLVRAGLRMRADLVVEAGDCCDDHHLAVLIGYGAGAVCPWLALATAGGARVTALLAAFEAGLFKILSKMGISTVASYRGGQIFEILGLADEVVDRCFAGTPNRIGGLGFAALERALLQRHAAAFAAGGRGGTGDAKALPDHGLVRYRRGDGKEHHCWAPPMVRALQRSVGSEKSAAGAPDPAAWEEFIRLAAECPARLRDLLDFVAAGPSLPLETVEPAESIVRRFITSPMSLGALSPEAHRTLTIAMNQLGARSNTGEGGEDPETYRVPPGGVRLDSKVKQVASGRFGVTTEYIARAEELEIKIAQGSKPGEGGQLPGHKVTELIARLRHAQPGIALISPPPHHDIYSIEDLAQLIYDLKRCNPRSKVGVKLVSEAGVGTIAAGVAKAYADFVFICGHSGGTGASALSSIKHAGSPWELGLAETQQVLIRNGLRSRIRVRADGGLMTGRDVMLAALLGAEEFGFGTAALVAMGCDMARQCHLNTCPTGIATQNPELRAKFRGTPEQVMRYFLHVAEEVRQLLATLGLRSLDEAVGRVDLLRQVHFPADLDLSRLLVPVEGDAPRCLLERNDRPQSEEPVDEALLRNVLAQLSRGKRFQATLKINNRDRSIGARIAGELALRWGLAGLEPGTVELRFRGSAGQSFGAFCYTGMRLVLDGEANDYVGKGLSGGELILRPVGAARSAPRGHVILGNVALYGATSGRLFAAGRAGERFAVRNSGAVAVVEGVGDHGCEYLTGGCVVVLGETGTNFGAGMTGGVAYVLDEDGAFPRRVNPGTVTWARADAADLGELRTLVEEHERWTRSRRAAALLATWDTMRDSFWKVEPQPVETTPEVSEASREGRGSAGESVSAPLAPGAGQ